MAIAFRAQTTVTYNGTPTTGVGNGTNIAIPASVQAGDLLVLALTWHDSFTAPSGWTLQGTRVLGISNANAAAYVYTRTAVAGDAGTNVFIASTVATNNGGSASLVAYSGGASMSGFTFGTNATSATTATVPAQTIGSVGQWFLYAGHANDAGGTATPGFTAVTGQNVRSNSSSMYFRQAVADEAPTATGTTGTRSYTQSTVTSTIVGWSATLSASLPLGRATTTNTARPLAYPRALGLGRPTTTNTARPVAAHNEHVQFHGSTLAAQTSGTTKTATIPASTAVGDTILMVVASRDTITTPAGWTLLHAWTLYAGTAPNWRTYAFTKTAASGDAGSTVTLTLASSEYASVAIASYGGSLGVPTDTAKIQYTTDPGTSGYGRFTPNVTAGPGSKLVGLFGGVQTTAASDTPYLGWPSDGQLRATGAQTFTQVAIADSDRDSGSDYLQVNVSAQPGRWAAMALTLDPVPIPTDQSIPVGQAGSTSSALPLGVYRPTVATDKTNRVGGRVRDGLGVAAWEPPVEAAPSAAAPPLAYDVAHAFGAVTRKGSQPHYTVTTARKVRHRVRIVVGGKDVTYFRGIPTPPPSYQLIAPLLYGPATLTFPQIAGTFEKLGTGDRKWLRKGAPVKVQRVDDTGTVVATDYLGVIIAFNLDGANLSVEVGGQASGRAALINKQTPLWHAVHDAGTMAYDAIRNLRLRFEPRLGPNTGINLANWGGESWLDYINELCAKAQDREGTQWSLMPDSTGAYRFRRKDTTTVDATVYLDDARCVGNLRRDIAEEPNRIYMTGVNPQGRRVRNAVYPGLNQGERPPYPFSDHGHTFGQGTTDADTDTGDGITVMVSRLWAMKYLDRDETPGGYDKDAKGAVQDLQEDAGLPVTGTMTWDTWRALFDLSATGYSLRGSHIEPMAQRSKVKPWLRTSSGAKLARNPDYDPSVLPVDLNVDAGVGFKASQLRDWARAELATEDNWVGTIALNTGAVIDGLHNPGDPLNATQVRRARSLKPGMNLWAPQFMGGTLFHISGISVDENGVSLSVDTRARDTMKVWEVILRNRETRANPARAWIAQHRSSTMTNDAVGEWDAAGGVIDKVRCKGNTWTVFEVPAGQEGTIRSLRVRTDNSPAEFVMAVFGRKVTPEWLGGKVPHPLTAPSTYTTTDADGNTHKHTRNDNAKAWESEKVRNRLDDRFLLYAAGTNEQPCGYAPGKKTNEDGDRTDDRITGKHWDDAGVSYHTFAEPVLYVAVFPDRDTVVQAGRIMWNQLEASS